MVDNLINLENIYKEIGTEEVSKGVQYEINLSFNQILRIVEKCKTLITQEDGYKQIFQYLVILRQFFTGQLYQLEITQILNNGEISVQRANFSPENLKKLKSTSNNDIVQIEYCCDTLKKEALNDQQAINNLMNVLNKIASIEEVNNKMENQYYFSMSNLSKLRTEIIKENTNYKRLSKNRKNEAIKEKLENHTLTEYLYQIYANDKQTIGSFTSQRSGTSFFAWGNRKPEFSKGDVKIFTKDQFKTYNKGHVVEEFLSNYRKNSKFRVNNFYNFALIALFIFLRRFKIYSASLG